MAQDSSIKRFQRDSRRIKFAVVFASPSALSFPSLGVLRMPPQLATLRFDRPAQAGKTLISCMPWSSRSTRPIRTGHGRPVNANSHCLGFISPTCQVVAGTLKRLASRCIKSRLFAVARVGTDWIHAVAHESCRDGQNDNDRSKTQSGSGPQAPPRHRTPNGEAQPPVRAARMTMKRHQPSPMPARRFWISSR